MVSCDDAQLLYYVRYSVFGVFNDFGSLDTIKGVWLTAWVTCKMWDVTL